MDAIALTLTGIIISVFVVWMIPDGKKTERTSAEPAKPAGVLARFKRMSGYNLIIVDLPDSPEPLLRNNVTIEVAGMPFIDKQNEVGAYASEVVIKMVLRLVSSGSALVLSDIRPHSKFFGLKAEVMINGQNVGEYVTANFTPPPPKPIYTQAQLPAPPPVISNGSVDQYGTYRRGLN